MGANGGLLSTFEHGFFALTPALRHNIALFTRHQGSTPLAAVPV